MAARLGAFNGMSTINPVFNRHGGRCWSIVVAVLRRIRSELVLPGQVGIRRCKGCCGGSREAAGRVGGWQAPSSLYENVTVVVIVATAAVADTDVAARSRLLVSVRTDGNVRQRSRVEEVARYSMGRLPPAVSTL